MSDTHARLRESLGAYLLGALDPADRHEVEAHLATCASCRDELSRLSALPPLLGRLSEDEAIDARLLPPPDLAPRVVLAAAADAQHLHRQVRRWRLATAVAAAAALLATVIAVDPFAGPPDVGDPLVASAQAVAPDAAATAGTAAAYEWEWGTTVELDVKSLPPRDGYVVHTVDQQGRREQAGTWGPTAARAARLRSASAIDRARLERVEVTDTDGQLLFVFEFDA